MNTEIRKKEIAGYLLDIGAVFFRPEEPFTWASGIKSPVYCDNRLILTAPAARYEVEKAITEKVKKQYPEAEALFGTSTAGIAHAAIAAHMLGMPMGYVRSSGKDHGRNNQIEGRLDPGTKVVVIEDLISTAGSVCRVVEALRDAGAEVLGIISIFTYGMQRGVSKLEETGVSNDSLTDFETAAQLAFERAGVDEAGLKQLKEFIEKNGR